MMIYIESQHRGETERACGRCTKRSEVGAHVEVNVIEGRCPSTRAS